MLQKLQQLKESILKKVRALKARPILQKLLEPRWGKLWALGLVCVLLLLSVLLPKELTLEDRLLLTVLATAVEYQPKRSFAGYVSTRGKFPAVYLKARFRGGKWFFHDYRFE